MMKKPSARKRRKGYADIEQEFGDLFVQLSSAYNKAVDLTETLKVREHPQASLETFELAVLLKNALRVCGDAMSRLPS
jgi:hypothetical protein